jgi:endonuclease/exonuclease/phosphatase family metal-dependent hydrolase
MKAGYFKKISKLFLWFFAIVTMTILTLGNAAAFLPGDTYWMLAIAGLLFPIAFAANVLGVFIAAIFKHKIAWLFLLMLISSIPNLSKTIAYNAENKLPNSSTDSILTVMSWNVGILNFSAPDSITAIAENKKIFQEIKNSAADVVCLQEFFSALYPGSHYNMLDSVARTLDYPYYYFSKDHQYFSGEFYSGSVIFSRYPIIDTLRLPFKNGSEGAILKATVQKGETTIDVITSRLQSVYLNGYDYATLGMQRKEDKLWSGIPTIIRKLRYGFRNRASQVALLDSILQQSSEASIICVDLNDTPTGNAYHLLQKNRNDVWRTSGKGLGKTFKLFSPTLRIDYIFYSNFFESISVQRIESTASDHFALRALLRIKKGVR